MTCSINNKPIKNSRPGKLITSKDTKYIAGCLSRRIANYKILNRFDVAEVNGKTGAMAASKRIVNRQTYEHRIVLLYSITKPRGPMDQLPHPRKVQNEFSPGARAIRNTLYSF